MAKLRCRKCNHKWQSNSETRACPFCGASNLENVEVTTRYFDIDAMMK